MNNINDNNNNNNSSNNDDMNELKKYIGKEIRIIINDNRVIEGEFQCLDRELNFIIGGAIELHGNIDSDDTNQKAMKRLGMVLIPGKHIVKCMVKK